MNAYIAEFIGTALLIVFGNGGVANVLLLKTKGHNAGWLTITMGWGLGVFVAVFCVAPFSGAHINPAVSVALAIAGRFEWALVPGYVLSQFAGGALGATLVWLFYIDHFKVSKIEAEKLAIFCTGPAIRNKMSNLFSEVFGTFVLVFGVLYIATPEVGLGALDALPVGLLVLVIGISLGGTTGYAINPARDLPPRLMHQLLPIPGKGDSDWGYSWIPVVGPILGGGLAAATYLIL